MSSKNLHKILDIKWAYDTNFLNKILTTSLTLQYGMVFLALCNLHLSYHARLLTCCKSKINVVLPLKCWSTDNELTPAFSDNTFALKKMNFKIYKSLIIRNRFTVIQDDINNKTISNQADFQKINVISLIAFDHDINIFILTQKIAYHTTIFLRRCISAFRQLLVWSNIFHVSLGGK